MLVHEILIGTNNIIKLYLKMGIYNEKVLTGTQVKELLDSEFDKFISKYHGIIDGTKMQTLAKFIANVKEELDKPQINNT